MTTTLNADISAAVERLNAEYPKERCKVSVYTNDPDGFSVSIGVDTDYIFECGETLDEALQHAIEVASARDPESKKQARIEELKRELKELEAK